VVPVPTEYSSVSGKIRFQPDSKKCHPVHRNLLLVMDNQYRGKNIAFL